MPRGKKIDLPDTIERSDKHAQEIYRETLESAHESYEGDEERSHRAAYAALKHQYKKSDDKWVKKDRKGPSDEQAARGPETSPSTTDSPARTKGGRVDTEGTTKDELYYRANRLAVSCRSK